MSNIRLKEFYVFIPMLIAYLVLGVLYPFLSVDITKFLLFQLLFLLLPGYIFSRWLMSEELTKIQRFIFGYPVSMIVIFILSWAGKLLDIKYLESIILFFSIVAIYKIIKDSKRQAACETNAPIAIHMIFYGICIGIVFRMFIIPSSPPTPGHPGLFYQDSLFTIGNTWAYIRGFPLEDPRFSGVLFGYHMLQNIYQATVYNFTKIIPFNTHFYIEPIFDWFIMVSLILYGGLKIARLSLRQTVIFCMGLFFTTPFLARRMQLNLFVNPISLFFGLSVFILFLFYIISYLNKKRELDILYLTVLFVYFTATKAILGIIILFTLTLLFIFRVFKKRYSAKEALLLLGLFLGAVLLKFTIFKNTIHSLHYDYDTSTSLAYRFLGQIPFLAGYKDLIYPFYRFFSSFFRYLPRYIFSWPVLLFLTTLFLDTGFRRRLIDIKDSLICILIFFLVSITVGCLFMFPGAEIYNIWYTEAVFLILGAISLGYILNKDNVKCKIIAFSLLTLGVIVFSADLTDWVNLGWAGLPNVKARIWDERASISHDEFLAMKWLQKNTKPGQVFFSGRRFFAHESSRVDVPRFYGYTALSGRQAFMEGGDPSSFFPDRFRTVVVGRWDLIDTFLSTTDSSRQEDLLKNIKADYFIQSLRFNNKDFSKVTGLNLIYENKDIKIFKILRTIEMKEV